MKIKTNEYVIVGRTKEFTTKYGKNARFYAVMSVEETENGKKVDNIYSETDYEVGDFVNVAYIGNHNQIIED